MTEEINLSETFTETIASNCYHFTRLLLKNNDVVFLVRIPALNDVSFFMYKGQSDDWQLMYTSRTGIEFIHIEKQVQKLLHTQGY